MLFEFSLNHKPYKLDRLLSDTATTTVRSSLIKKLEEYKLAHPAKEITTACDTIIEDISSNVIRDAMPEYVTSSELTLLRAVIAERCKQIQKEPLQETIKKLAPFIEIEQSIF